MKHLPFPPSVIQAPIRSALLAIACSVLSSPGNVMGDAELRDRLKDQNAMGADFWIYNDLEEAKAVARRTKKPIFVTFRCVPCKDCKGFDAEVAGGSEVIELLAKTQFVPVRQVEMKGVDLSRFQFDYDLNWAAMFINPDGTVYGRYGTQSAEGADAYNSIESLEKAMLRALELHEYYPANAGQLAGKRGKPKPYRTALEMPGLDRKETLRGRTELGNCIHCHNIHDAQHYHAQQQGTFNQDMLWRYPLPDNVGLRIDPKDGRRVRRVHEDSSAAMAGIRAGDSVMRVESQPIISIADIQWVLHQLPNTAASVKITIDRDGELMEKRLQTSSGWKRTDISWRGSIWSVSPRLRVWAPSMTKEERKEKGMSENQEAMLVKWLNRDKPGGKAAYDAGLRQGDVIVGLEGKPLQLTETKFQTHIKLHYAIGDTLPLTILRDGRSMRIDVPLVE